MKNDSESLNDVFKKLMDIKHKIRNVKTEKKNKICQLNSNLSNINKSEKIEHRNNYNQNDYHYSRNNNNNTYYNTHFHTFNSNIVVPKFILSYFIYLKLNSFILSIFYSVLKLKERCYRDSEKWCILN
jgi:hypothetical protein